MKLILKTLVITAVIWGVLKLTPAGTKKALGEKMGEVFSFIVPEKAKEKLEPIFLSPIERRAKIISQLEKNIASMEETFDAQGADSPVSEKKREAALEVIKETKEEVAKLSKANKDQGVVNKITSGVFQAVGGALGLAPKMPAEAVSNVACPDKN